jgi:hypothetical protein
MKYSIGPCDSMNPYPVPIDTPRERLEDVYCSDKLRDGKHGGAVVGTHFDVGHA